MNSTKNIPANSTCVLCGKTYAGHGHNPAPVSFTGRCCDACMNTRVLFSRMHKNAGIGRDYRRPLVLA